MRLLVVSTWFPYPPDNGSRLRAYHLLGELARCHSTTLLTFGTAADQVALPSLRALCERVEIAEGPARPRHLSRRGLFSLTPRFFVQSDCEALRALVARAVTVHDAAIGLEIDAARYLAPLRTIPRVFEEVEVAAYRDQYLREMHPAHRVRHGLTWWKFSRFVRRLVDQFECATVVSNPEREHLRAIGCAVERVTVVPNGVALATGAPPATRAERLIYPGAVTYSANLDAVRYFVEEVFPRLRGARPSLEFWVTGSVDGVNIDDLRRPGVTFTGWLPEVDSAIAGSAACVVPLRVGGGTRLKVLQAMALGTPVVSTTKGIEGLEIEPERHVLVADTPGEFARQVERLMTNPPLRDGLTAAAREFVERRHAWRPIGRLLNSVIERAVAEHRRRAEHP